MDIGIQRDILGLKGQRFTRRFCRMISGLCRHVSIQAVCRHLEVRWETLKNIDKGYLEETIPALAPSQLTGLKYLGVEAVAMGPSSLQMPLKAAWEILDTDARQYSERFGY